MRNQKNEATGYEIAVRHGVLSFLSRSLKTDHPRATVFLDRDGVLNRRMPNGYVTQWAEFSFLLGVKQALRRLKRAGFQLVIVSNQAGVAKGLLTKKDLIKITVKCLQELADCGGKVDAAFFCMHHPKGACHCRKPRTGLLREAACALPINFRRAFLVGDSLGDIKAGNDVGCRTIYLRPSSPMYDVTESPADLNARNLREAVNWILVQNSKAARREYAHRAKRNLLP